MPVTASARISAFARSLQTTLGRPLPKCPAPGPPLHPVCYGLTEACPERRAVTLQLPQPGIPPAEATLPAATSQDSSRRVPCVLLAEPSSALGMPGEPTGLAPLLLGAFSGCCPCLVPVSFFFFFPSLDSATLPPEGCGSARPTGMKTFQCIRRNGRLTREASWKPISPRESGKQGRWEKHS